MLHKVEIILRTIFHLCSGLPSVGDNVFRSLVHGNDAEKLPALNIRMGTDTPLTIDVSNISFNDSMLAVNCEAVCKKLGYSDIETTLNEIRAEATAAIMADRKLGLDFVYDVVEVGAEEPQFSGEGEKPLAVQRFSFNVKYRRSLIDPRL